MLNIAEEMLLLLKILSSLVVGLYVRIPVLSDTSATKHGAISWTSPPCSVCKLAFLI